MTIDWVILTRGDRRDQLATAIESVLEQTPAGRVVVVQNGSADTGVESLPGCTVVRSPVNLGVPGGRDEGMRAATSDIVGFLDDDAVILDARCSERLLHEFASSPHVGAISLRIVDETGRSARRHVPRLARSGEHRSGPVATFLGGACAIRRSAYEAAGGYWPELFYAHEELDLAWRMYEAGFSVRYISELEIRHPALPISRHTEGWRLTGRNRVMIARRNLPWPVAIPHVLLWAVIGARRAPRGACRDSYLAGWRRGWHVSVVRRPISWRTVWTLTRCGRPPII